MKIVSAYRKIVPYTYCHRRLVGCFDWVDALRMLRASAARMAGAEVYAITDQELPVPHYCYETQEPTLMLWILEVSLRYLESKQFDQDTVFVSPDCLVCKPLDVFGGFDLGVVAREPKFAAKKPLLNGVQFWAVAARDKLVVLFTKALAIARTLSDAEQRWGADTIPLVRLLAPIAHGDCVRDRLAVRVFDISVFHSVGPKDFRFGRKPVPGSRIVDFRYQRKLQMADYYQRMFG